MNIEAFEIGRIIIGVGLTVLVSFAVVWLAVEALERQHELREERQQCDGDFCADSQAQLNHIRQEEERRVYLENER